MRNNSIDEDESMNTGLQLSLVLELGAAGGQGLLACALRHTHGD